MEWILARDQADQRDDSAVIAGLTKEHILKMAEAVKGQASSVAPAGSADDVTSAMFLIKEALTMLRENYPNWNDAGKKHAVGSAIRSCESAWQYLNHSLPNAGANPTGGVK